MKEAEDTDRCLCRGTYSPFIPTQENLSFVSFITLLLHSQVPQGKLTLSGHNSIILPPETLEQKWACNSISTKHIWGGICWGIQKEVLSLLWESSESYFFLLLAVVICCCSVCIFWSYSAPSWGVGQSWENCRRTQPEPLDNASSKVHLTSEFPAMKANSFLNV